MNQTADLYSALGVDKTATPEEIRAAYYRLIRKHSPERDPEGFKALRAAYETLSNLKSRVFYDEMQAHGKEAEGLLVETVLQVGLEAWAKAIKPLRRLLVLVPSHVEAWGLLGLSLFKLQKWAEASMVFGRVVGEDPSNPQHWAYYGWCHFELAVVSQEHYEKLSFLKAARDCFVRAHQLLPLNSEYHMAIARTHVEAGEYDSAVIWAEMAFADSHKVQLDDIHHLAYLCLICVMSGNDASLTRAVGWMQKIKPTDEVQKKVAAQQFASLSVSLLKVGHTALARDLIDHAVSLQPQDEELKMHALRAQLSARARTDRP